MKPFIYLQGYATTFEQAEQCNGTLEFFDRDAFRDQLAAPHDVFLNFGTHDAPPLAAPLTLFTDGYGLGFTIAVSAAQWRSIRSAITRDCTYCSVHLVSSDRQPERLGDGRSAMRVTRASIDHVTICATPVFSGTGVWSAESGEELPRRLRLLRARWHFGRQAWRDRVNGKAPPAVGRALAARADGHREFRLEAAALFAKGVPLVIGHAAFTKAAEFCAEEFIAQASGARVGWRNPSR